jgi:hypothetical protein
MQNTKRIVGAAGRRFDTDIGVTQEESEAMLSSLPKLPKASDIAKGVAKFGLYVAPITGEYYAAKDYKEYSKKYVDALERYREIQNEKKEKPMVHQAGMFTGAGPVVGNFLMSGLAAAGMIPVFGYGPRLVKAGVASLRSAAKGVAKEFKPKMVETEVVKVVEPTRQEQNFYGSEIRESSYKDTKRGDYTRDSHHSYFFKGQEIPVEQYKNIPDQFKPRVSEPYKITVKENPYFPHTDISDIKAANKSKEHGDILRDFKGGEQEIPTDFTNKTSKLMVDQMGIRNVGDLKPALYSKLYHTLETNPKIPNEGPAKEWAVIKDGKLTDGYLANQGIKNVEFGDTGVLDYLAKIQKENPNAIVSRDRLMRLVEESPMANVNLVVHKDRLQPNTMKVWKQLIEGTRTHRAWMKNKKSGVPYRTRIKPDETEITESKFFAELDKSLRTSGLPLDIDQYHSSVGGIGKDITYASAVERNNSWRELVEIKLDQTLRAHKKDPLKTIKDIDIETKQGFEQFTGDLEFLRPFAEDVHKAWVTEMHPSLITRTPKYYGEKTYNYDGATEYTEFILTGPRMLGQKVNTKQHKFSETEDYFNSIWHLRGGLHTTMVDGSPKKVFVISEHQADEIQKLARAEGRKGKIMQDYEGVDIAEVKRLKKEMEAGETQIRELEQTIEKLGTSADSEDVAIYKKLVDDMDKKKARYERKINVDKARGEGFIPGREVEDTTGFMPFGKGDQSTSTRSALRYIARYASERGDIDYVAISPGQFHAGGAKPGMFTHYGDSKGKIGEADGTILENFMEKSREGEITADEARKRANEMSKKTARMPAELEQLAKETGTTTKTINVHHSHPVKNKAGNYVEPSYVVRHYKSKNPIKYFDSKQDAEKWVENNYGFLKGKRMGERTGEPDELVNYATDIVEISSDVKKGKNDMFAIEIKGDKLKEPISAYKEGGLVLLDEAREYYK